MPDQDHLGTQVTLLLQSDSDRIKMLALDPPFAGLMGTRSLSETGHLSDCSCNRNVQYTALKIKRVEKEVLTNLWALLCFKRVVSTIQSIKGFQGKLNA